MSLEHYMENLSKDMELEESLKSTIPNVYSIPLEDGYSVTVTSPSPERFHLSCTLGPCPNVGKEAFFTELLLADLFGQGTRGAVLGLDIEAERVTLTQTVDYHIEYKEFKDIVEDFLNIADFWRQEVLSGSAN